MNPGKSILLAGWLCLSAAFMALLPKFYMVFDSGNRYSLLWSNAYHWAILSAIALLAALFFAAQFALRRLGQRFGLTRWAEALCMLWLIFVGVRTVFALLVQLGTLPHTMMELLWNPWFKLVFYVVLPVPMLVLWPSAAKQGLKRLYAGLSVLCVLFVVQSTFWVKYEKYDATLDGGAASKKTADGRNFLVFILDGWSYERTFGEPNWGEKFPAISNLLNEATLYAKAYSLGAETWVSIPRFLFSNDHDFLKKTYQETIDFNLEGAQHQGQSIFDIVPDNWMRLAIGTFINYDVIIPRGVDVALKFEGPNVRRTYKKTLENLIQSQFAFLRIVGVRFEYVGDPEWFPQMEIHQYTMETLRANQANVFGVFHYCWPHWPYIWDRQGRKPGIAPESAAAEVQSVENYMDNLGYMDTVVGEVCAGLKECGKWENSVVVFTSDHTWRFDPAISNRWTYDSRTGEDRARMIQEDANPTQELKHVPMIIKLPGQKSGKVVDSEVVTHGNVFRLLEAYLRGDDLSDASALLRLDPVAPDPR
jgi:hypothetical protein